MGLAAGHMNMTVEKHTKALQRVVGDLTQKFGWVDQVSHVQIVGSATSEDVVLVQEAESVDMAQHERRPSNPGIVDVNAEQSKDRRLSKPAALTPTMRSKSPTLTPSSRGKSKVRMGMPS